jgi:hypothetical protein
MGGSAGKGDADRSPGWRNHYHEVNWGSGTASRFESVGPKRIRKVYGESALRPRLEDYRDEKKMVVAMSTGAGY